MACGLLVLTGVLGAGEDAPEVIDELRVKRLVIVEGDSKRVVLDGGDVPVRIYKKNVKLPCLELKTGKGEECSFRMQNETGKIRFLCGVSTDGTSRLHIFNSNGRGVHGWASK